jgi:hypothetical protein
MVHACRAAGVPLLINENWRWQAPLRELKRILDTGEIGTPFRARLDMISGFPVFRNQPFLRELDRFILMDLGSHILDVARFLFGEATSLYCQTHKVHSDIEGEDVATVMLHMGGKTTVVVEMAYAENPLERECFPQTLVFVEGDKGSLELGTDYWLKITTASGTATKRVSSSALFMGQSRIRGRPFQHCCLSSEPAAGLEWRAGGNHGGGQLENHAAGICVLRIGGRRQGSGVLKLGPSLTGRSGSAARISSVTLAFSTEDWR